MKTITNILTLGLFLSLTYCSYSSSKTSIEKTTINFEKVERIEIKNNPLGQINEKIDLKELTTDQAKVLVSNWNYSKSKGPCKFGLQYWLFVIFKDGTKRIFRANGQYIKEYNDWCYDIGNEHFFKNLYTNASPIPAEKKKKFDLIQGLWFHQQDRLATVTINNYWWTFNYKSKQANPDDTYSISITDKLPEFVKETEHTEFIILTNKTDTLQYEILGLTDSTFSMMHFPSDKIHLYRKSK